MAAGALAERLRRHEARTRLRFITCGSVDDGKSTLIGRLLHDSRLLHDDQLAALARDSRRHGTQGERIDFALLVDGLAAEREQGITIDVAYRYFATAQRSFIVADCPGHEQYTRNMATGASTADLAVVLVDARKGLLAQTRRHSHIVALLGIRQVLLAVNKMDLVGFGRERFEEIAEAYRALAARLGIDGVQAIPVCALDGDNLCTGSDRMPWYQGPTLLAALEAAPARGLRRDGPLRLPVQWVNRPDPDFRGLAGTVCAGAVAPGDSVVVLPGGRRTRIARVLGPEGEVPVASAGQAVTVVLDDAVDAGRGDLIAAANDPPEVADQFAAHLLWMADKPLYPGRSYWLTLGTRTVTAQVTEIRHRIDIDTGAELAARHLELNAIANVRLSLDQPVPFEPYAADPALGGFILIDREDHGTVAAGMVDFALRRAGNIHWQHLDVDRAARARIKGQQPRVLWFTGLSGAGKSTIANLVEKRLHARGFHTFILDGDNVRHGLNRDLGFTAADRVENIRRVAEVARLMTDAGLIVLVSFISPFRAERRLARERFPDGEFIEVHVKASLATAEARDAKGLYAKARAGLIPNFTGIDSPYEVPEAAELVLDTETETAEDLATRVVDHLLAGMR
ncbi:MAG: sulfate adenylyltransferase subunit CysN [Xanthomonadales bacterium]|nr:sulfate adenylyltransferase subunit CysN [Xanthomonadales bacterium]